MMISNVLLMVNIKSKVLYSIILFSSIQMMYYFYLRKIPTQIIFHYKSVLKYIAFCITKRVIGAFYIHIPSFIQSSTPSPSRTFFHTPRIWVWWVKSHIFGITGTTPLVISPSYLFPTINTSWRLFSSFLSSYKIITRPTMNRVRSWAEFFGTFLTVGLYHNQLPLYQLL